MLLFLIVSLSMVGNFFLLYLNERTGDSNRPFSLTPTLIGWSQIVNLAVFVLSCCFESFLRNIQMKVKGEKNELIFNPEPGREYIYFGKILHRIYINLGLHICRKVALNSSELLDMREKRPKSRRESKTTRYIPEVLKPSNISYLINDWESEFQDLDACRLCKLSQYISVCEKDESFSLLCSLDPFIELDAMCAAVLIGNDFCIPFDCATDLYNDPGKYLHRDDYSLQVAKKFVDSLMCILQLFKLVYVEDLELREILTVFHLFKSFAYDTLHYHVHELLTSEASRRESKNKDHTPCAMSEWPGSKISDYLSSDLSNLTMDLESQNIEFRKLSADLTDVSLLSALNTKLKGNSPTRSQEAKCINKVGNGTNIHCNLRVFDNKRWRMLHWRSDLDDIVNVLLDSIVLIPPKETISNLHKMELKLERIETIFLYAESLLLKCMWRNNLCETCIDLDNFERSPWKIPQITMIEERVLIQDLTRNFQTFFLSREAKIEKAINKVEDAIFVSLLNVALKETKHRLPRPYVNVVAANLTNQAIADAKEEISTEKYYSIFALSRLAFFVRAAKFLNENRDFIVKCPILGRFLEVSQTDLNHSEELMFSLAETIFYKMSQGISEFVAFKRTQYFFEKSQIGAICGRVLSKTQDQITALTFTFLTDIIRRQKILRKLNLTSKYVSASLEQFSEQLQRLVMDRFKESMRQQEFSDLCSKRMSFLLRNTVKEVSLFFIILCNVNRKQSILIKLDLWRYILPVQRFFIILISFVCILILIMFWNIPDRP